MKQFCSILNFAVWFCAFCSTIQIQALPTDTAAISFGWETPLRFEVEETDVKNRITLKTRHSLGLVAINDELVLAWLDSKVLSVNGLSIDKSLENLAETTRELFLSTPPMRISRNGEFLGLIDSGEAIEKCNGVLNKYFPDRPKSARKFFSNAAQSTNGQELLANAICNRYWGPWVQLWLGLRIEPNQTFTNVTTVELQNSTFSWTNVYSRTPSNKPDEMALHVEQIASGPAVGTMMLKSLKSLGDLTPPIEKQPFPVITAAKMHSTTDIRAMQDTFRPSWVKHVVYVRCVTSESTNIVRESYEYNFFWKRE